MDLTPFTATEVTARRDGWSAQRKARFLDRLAACGNVRSACALVGMSREAAYRLRRRDALFARGWDAALVLARPRGAEVLADKATEGIEEEVWKERAAASEDGVLDDEDTRSTWPRLGPPPPARAGTPGSQRHAARSTRCLTPRRRLQTPRPGPCQKCQVRMGPARRWDPMARSRPVHEQPRPTSSRTRWRVVASDAGG